MKILVNAFHINKIASLKKLDSRYKTISTVGFNWPKLKHLTVTELSERLTDKIISHLETATSNESSTAKVIADTLFTPYEGFLHRIILEHIIQNSFASSFKAEKSIAGYIKIQSEEREHFSERIKEELKKTYIPTHTSESESTFSSSDFVGGIKKSYTLCRSHLKNFIKRLLTWSNQKPKKARLSLQTIIKFIITPRLFGIYVSEEENKGLAICSFSNC